MGSEGRCLKGTRIRLEGFNRTGGSYCEKQGRQYGNDLGRILVGNLVVVL